MSEETEVAVLDQRPLVPAVVFAPGGAMALVERIEAETRAIKTDISTPKGRDAVRSLAYKVARSKTALDEMGKKLTDDARAKIDAVNVDRRAIRERLEALATEVRAPLTAWEDAEKARVAEHERQLAAIPEAPGYGQHESAEEISLRLDYLRAYPARDWLEFRQRFEETMAREIQRMEALYDVAVTREAEAAELARLRAEAAERERQEAARLQAEREARIAAEAAEAARLEAERAAAEAAQAAAAQAARDRAEAILAERSRIAAEAAVAEREAAARAADRAHRAQINGAAAKALVEIGLTEEQAKAVVTALVKGGIPHVAISY